MVRYQQLEPDLYNLAFGDWDEQAQELKDGVRSNNHDRDKVLVTVASTVLDFMQYHPEATLYAEGITPAKTRLYQMGINAHWQEITPFFDVQGFEKGRWEPFQQHKNYEAFALKTK